MAILRPINRNHTSKGNMLRGKEWLQLKALLCFGAFWQTVNKND